MAATFMTARIASVAWILLFSLVATTLVIQALTNAPTSDEAGHLVAGIAMMQSGDPGFYRVNPPLHKLISGAAVQALYQPKMPTLYPASLLASGSRNEFVLAEQFVAMHTDDHAKYFVAGRLVRIPLVLLSASLLLRGFPTHFRTAASVATVLWLTSPLLLGHGWTMMPDALSGCAMILLLVATRSWLRCGDRWNFVLVGLAWGLAIGTKFTFCPVYVGWPIALLAYQWTGGSLTYRSWYRLPLCHVGHGCIALLVVIGLYGGSELAVPFDQHPVRSHTMTSIREFFGSLPSPFPKQFLVGIDEQQLDLERGYPTYFLGTWYPNGIWWYYFLGLLVKEQIALWAALVLSVFGGWTLFRPKLDWATPDRETQATALEAKAMFALCVIIVLVVFAILTWHSKMAICVRYIFPALPPLYLAIGIGVSSLKSAHPKLIQRILLPLILVMIAEWAGTFPNFFSYANPVFGGSYRVPPVLNDSNFDGGQDLWRLEKYLAASPAPLGVTRYTCVHSEVSATAAPFQSQLPPISILRQILSSRTPGAAPILANDSEIELIVMRGLGVPAPWTLLIGSTDSLAMIELTKLLKLPPDEFMTPTLAVYRLRSSKSAQLGLAK